MNFLSNASSVAIALVLHFFIIVSGFPTIAQEISQTNEHFEDVLKRAEGGDAIAQNLLGTLYQLGSGTASNLETASAWYERAAAQGHAAAQVNLATL